MSVPGVDGATGTSGNFFVDGIERKSNIQDMNGIAGFNENESVYGSGRNLEMDPTKDGMGWIM